jgi:NAD(P)H-dependent FMN reductase
MKIAIIEASLSKESNSKKMAKYAEKHLVNLGAQVDVILQEEVGQVAIYGSGHQNNALMIALRERLSDADAYIWAVPVYCTGVSGCAKNLLDQFSSCFSKKWFAIISAAGRENSLYAVNSFAMELALESQAPFIPKFVLATDSGFNEEGEPILALAKRLDCVAKSLFEASKTLKRMPL